MCWAHVWTIHHSPSMNICIPPGLLSAPHPFLLTDAAQCVLHHVTSELISPRTHKHDWFSPTVPANRGQCAGFQKKIKNKRANVFFFGPGQLRRGHSVLLVIRATSVCHHLCGPVLEQRQRGLRASGATAHACSQAFSSSSHFCTYLIWAKLKDSLTTATVNPFLSFLLWFQHKSIFSASHKRHLKHTLRQRSRFLQTL